MKDNITRDEFRQRLIELVPTWRLCKPQDVDRITDDNISYWINGCMPFTGSCAEHNKGYEERPHLVITMPNISRYEEEVDGYLGEFVLAACKDYAEKLRRYGFSHFEI